MPCRQLPLKPPQRLAQPREVAPPIPRRQRALARAHAPAARRQVVLPLHRPPRDLAPKIVRLDEGREEGAVGGRREVRVRERGRGAGEGGARAGERAEGEVGLGAGEEGGDLGAREGGWVVYAGLKVGLVWKGGLDDVVTSRLSACFQPSRRCAALPLT